MLCSLAIRNFVLINELELDFEQGFSVITGETGSGKSIILDAILFAFGKKFPKSIVKSGADKATVTLRCDTTPVVHFLLEKNEIDFEKDESLTIRRVMNKDGKSKLFVNDQMISKKLLSELMELIIEVHGQHSHTTLLDSKTHMQVLDEYAQNLSLQEKIANIYKNLVNFKQAIKNIEQRRDDIEEEIEYLEYTCLELEDSNIKIGEAEQLQEIKANLQNREKEIAIVFSILESFNQSEIGQIIARAQKNISRSKISERYIEIDAHLESIFDHFEEARNKIEQIATELQDQEYSLEEIDDRLHLIKELARKHSCLPDELLEMLKKSKTKLVDLKSIIADSSQLVKKFEEQKEEFFKHALILSESRKLAAQKLEKSINNEFADLEMKKARFSVLIDTDNTIISPKGIDSITFCASTNPGMSPGAINEIASGGELSRLMLALRVTLFSELSYSKGARVVVFDEIDVGISGSVAESIGSKLKTMSKHAQILAITHQPQVAGKADNHILVEKKQFVDCTTVKATYISGNNRYKEIARMISGKQITEIGMKAAAELISEVIEK